MSVQIGIDLVDVAEIEASLARHGDRFLHRVYSAAELARAPEARAPALAARFAAKEATIKALRIADEAIGWRSIEVLGDPGDPRVALSGAAASLAAARGVTALSLSLTRCRGHAAAVVVAEAER